MEARTRISMSYLKTWMDCPLQAKFKYLDNLPQKQNAAASFGNCVHHALEHYNLTGDVEAAVELFRDVWTNPEKLNVVPDTWPKMTSFGAYMNKGVDGIRDYHDRNRWDKREIIAVEHRFLVPFGEFMLDGIVDCLELKRGKTGKPQLRIVDLKTNARAPSLLQLRVDIQWTVYCYASMQPEFWMGNGRQYGNNYRGIANGERLFFELADTPRKNIWHGLFQQKEYDGGTRDDLDFLRLHRVCKEVKRAVELEVFVPDISGDSCTFCSYVEPCGLPITPPEEDE